MFAKKKFGEIFGGMLCGDEALWEYHLTNISYNLDVKANAKGYEYLEKIVAGSENKGA